MRLNATPGFTAFSIYGFSAAGLREWAKRKRRPRNGRLSSFKTKQFAEIEGPDPGTKATKKVGTYVGRGILARFKRDKVQPLKTLFYANCFPMFHYFLALLKFSFT